MAKDTGGAAFPREDYQSDYAPGQRGMTLRDYFAAKAMAALITGMASNEGFRQHVMSGYADLLLTEAVADLAYKHADAMVNERDL
jgi:hypothetical protein